MRNIQGASASDIAIRCNHLEMVSLFLPNNPEDETISLNSVIKSVGRFQEEPVMLDPLSFVLTPEQGIKSNIDEYPRELEKPSLAMLHSFESVDRYGRKLNTLTPEPPKGKSLTLSPYYLCH